MKIFVAGATGALGTQLVPRLVRAGHDVTGTTRTESKVAGLEAQGARAVVLDVLDADAVGQAVAEADPDVIAHEATALGGGVDLRHFDRTFAETNRLRIEGTDNLLAAARAAGVRRLVAQSYAGWPFARVGDAIKSEDAPLDNDPPQQMAEIINAIRYLERAVTSAEGIEGIVLRYGGFYGPNTSFGSEGEQTDAIRERKFPVVADGTGYFSFLHIADAADATLAAIERGPAGVYNITDDEPAPVKEWLPAAAEAAGAKPPRRVPRWLARLLAGEAMTVMLTEGRGASNAKAKRELGWRPAHASWRTGFVEALG